jgi:hypothetical protein
MRVARLLPFILGAVLVVGAGSSNAATPPAPRVDMPYSMTVRILDDQAGKYQVEVDNTNPTRFISSFNWSPPSGMNVVSIISAIGGRCRLSTDGIITCTGLAAPPSTADGVGAALIVDFTATGRQPTYANGYWIHYGVVGSVQIQTSKFNDVPICKKGQKSTAAHPCGNF